ncbi:hypothetical protein VPH35_074280 [Triticum aestivum]
MCAVWSNRNKYRHAKIQYQPIRSMEIIQEHTRALEIPTKKQQSQVHKTGWTKPLVGTIKINSDVALDLKGERAGTVVIARDHEGNFLSGRFSTYTGHNDPYVCEALGCRDAMLLAKEKGWERIQLVTDCKNVADDWNARRDRSSCGPVFREMGSYLSSFQGFEVRHSGREANETAHILAKHCLSTGVLSVTYDVIPDLLSAAVHLDYVRSMNE